MDGSPLASALTAALAQEIAGGTSDIIGFNVLITDRNGTVIGSGDSNRVGTFHEASVEVMHTLQPATHTAAQAQNLRGVRPGITLPIVLGETALGTVGITGAPGQVRRFGLVVKRQTEILLQESLLLRSRLLRERALEDLVRDIAYFDADVVESDLIVYRAGELGYDLGAPRVAIVIDLVGPPDHTEAAGAHESTTRLALLHTLRATFTATHDLVAAMPSDRFVALHRIPRAGGTDGQRDNLQALCHTAADEIARRHGLIAAVGIGDIADHGRSNCTTHTRTRAPRCGSAPGSLPAAMTDRRSARLMTCAYTSFSPRPATALRARLVEALTARLRAKPEWPVLRLTPHRLVRDRLQPGPRRRRAAYPPQHPRLPAQQDRTTDRQTDP